MQIYTHTMQKFLRKTIMGSVFLNINSMVRKLGKSEECVVVDFDSTGLPKVAAAPG